MIKTCQKFLIPALIVLQVVAPLVHAHTNTDGLHFGLHLPGLEFAAEQKQQLLFSGSPVYLDEGLIISVCSGIKQNPILVLLQQQDQEAGYWSVLSIPGISVNPIEHGCEISHGPLNSYHYCTARAPPAFNIS